MKFVPVSTNIFHKITQLINKEKSVSKNLRRNDAFPYKTRVFDSEIESLNRNLNFNATENFCNILKVQNFETDNFIFLFTCILDFVQFSYSCGDSCTDSLVVTSGKTKKVLKLLYLFVCFFFLFFFLLFF